MITFYLSRNDEGRAILDEDAYGAIEEVIQAKHRDEAREKISADLIKVDGYGYFFSPS